ncbi:MAG: PIN domain-containing protein [Deltaproteobacteria bacterium]|nr:MAG: PIN domain-containing protein [Deltaproteobacteria bacterium]
MNLLVDTSVWSLALRRDSRPHIRQVAFLRDSLERGGAIFTTGLVLQELLQRIAGPRARRQIVERFRLLPFVAPDRDDHIEAAELRNVCRRKGVQVGTIDALLARLCIRYDLVMLSTDADFSRIAKLRPLSVWSP